MSSRQLRKLERQRLENSATPEPQEDVDDKPQFNVLNPPAKSFNAFAFLNDDDVDDNDDGNEDEDKSDTQYQPLPKTESKPKKKLKKLKKLKSASNIKQTEGNSDDELDKVLAELEKERAFKNSSQAQELVDPEEEEDWEEEYDISNVPVEHCDVDFKFFTTKRLQLSLSLLSIQDVQNLDPDYELQALFGKLSMETIDDANSTTSLAISPEVLQQFKKIARLTRGWGGKDRKSVPGTSRKLLLTRIKDDYLPTTIKPMTMDEISAPEPLVEYFIYKETNMNEPKLERFHYEISRLKKESSSLGVTYFEFGKVDSSSEKAADAMFIDAVVLYPNPEVLMRQLQTNPYHTPTLLQTAMVLLRQGDNKLAANSLIEKALFTFDRCFHPSFHTLLAEGKTELIRLPYCRFMNRQFYLCLFRYIIGLGERATFSTATAYCKWLLALSPAEDPLGVRYFIDFYAMKAEQYKYILKFVESPLATTYEHWLTPGLAFSSVLALLHLNEKEKAKERLKLAYNRFPYLSYKLLEVHSHQDSVKFKATPSACEAVEAETYLVRFGALWENAQHRQWLCDGLVELFNTQTITSGQKNKKSMFSALQDMLGLTNVEHEIPSNLVRFAILSGEGRIMARLPQDIFSRDDMMEYDPLPPKSSNVGGSIDGIIGGGGSAVTDVLMDYVDPRLLSQAVELRLTAPPEAWSDEEN